VLEGRKRPDGGDKGKENIQWAMNECILNSMENGDGKGKSYSWDITRRLVAKGSANQLCCTWWKQYASNQVPGIILHLLQHLSDSGMPHLAVDVTFRNRQFNSQTQFMPQLTRCAKVRLNFSLKHTFFFFYYLHHIWLLQSAIALITKQANCTEETKET